jgi:probable lipoprotein LpqN
VRGIRWPAVGLAVLVASGCGAQTPDYHSIWTTSATSSASATAQAPVPLGKFLEDAGVRGDPVSPDKLTDLTVTLPRPPGWQSYDNANLAPGTRVIAKGDTYPTAMLVVIKLTGNFDVKEAVAHGYADAELSQNFERLNASNADWHGFPSSMIEGRYDLNGARMQSYNRVVFATGSPPASQRYLIQFTVTTFADKAQAEGPDIEAVIRGFTVAPK